MRSPPGVFLDLGKARSREGKGDGGPAALGGEASPACGVLGAIGGYGHPS